jgi:Tfp pilus assembly protein PilN
MRAVNLIPLEARPGGGAGSAGRSGGAAYALLGGLAVLVVLIAAWTLTGRGLNDKRREAARLRQEATAARTQADALAAYDSFATLRKQRVQTVESLAASRFDWATAMNSISRTMPADAWLNTMDASVTPDASAGGGGSAGSLRSAESVPAIEINGCTRSQAKVALLIARLRALPGVDRVALSDSAKSAPGGGGATSASSGGSGDACRGNHADWPVFDMVIFFGRAVPASLPGASASTAAAPATTANPATTGAASTATSTGAAGSTSTTSPSPTTGASPATAATPSTTGASR